MAKPISSPAPAPVAGQNRNELSVVRERAAVHHVDLHGVAVRTHVADVGPGIQERADRFKVARFSGKVVNFSPEFDDCLQAAAKHGMPVKDVLVAAARAYLDAHGSGRTA